MAMYFDQVAEIIERWAPDLVEMMESAALFVFDANPIKVLPKSYSDDEIAFLQESFFLPFETVAVEDDGSVVILQDKGPDETGLLPYRKFIDAVPVHPRNNDSYNDGDASIKESMRLTDELGLKPGTFQIAFGDIADICPLPGGAKYDFHGNVEVFLIASKKRVYSLKVKGQFPEEFWSSISTASSSNAVTAIQELAYFNSPDRWIVKKTKDRKPGVKQKKRRAGTITRSTNRPQYTLLAPKQIEEIFGAEPNVEGGPKKITHRRRKHYRRYPDDETRWPRAHGKIVTIPAKWVGRTSVVKKKTRYRVCVEL